MSRVRRVLCRNLAYAARRSLRGSPSLCVLVLLAVMVGACSAPTQAIPPTASVSSSPAVSTPERALALRRPLTPLASGTGCSASPGRDASTVPGAVGFQSGGYFAFGDGPVYPAFIPSNSKDAVLSWSDLGDPPAGSLSGYRFTKVLWISEPSFTGDVLVRPLPGSPVATFGHGDEPVQLEKFFSVPSSSGGILYFSSLGCYAFQIDTVSASRRFIVMVR